MPTNIQGRPAINAVDLPPLNGTRRFERGQESIPNPMPDSSSEPLGTDGSSSPARPLIDDEFKRLIPPLSPSEHRELEASLLADGRARDPLVTWSGILLDGHNRYDICQRHNLPFTMTSVELPDRDAAKVWMIRNQLGRRNLPPFARVELALVLEPLIAAEAQKRMLAGHPVPKSAQGRTRNTVADMAGVGGSAVAEAKLILGEGSDAEKDALRIGEVAIHTVYGDIRARQEQGGLVNEGKRGRASQRSASERDRLVMPVAVIADTAVPRHRVAEAMRRARRAFAQCGMDIDWKQPDAVRRLSDDFVPRRKPIDAIVRVNGGGPELWADKVADALCRQIIDREHPSTSITALTAFMTQQATAAVRRLMRQKVATMKATGTDVRLIRKDLVAAPVDTWIGIAVTPRIIAELIKIDDERCRSAAGTTLSLLAQATYVLRVPDDDIADEIRFVFEHLRVRIQKRIGDHLDVPLDAVLTEMAAVHKVPSSLAA